MKYCSHCGAQVHDEAVVCVNCGCAIAKEKQSNGDKGLLTAAKILMIISTAAMPSIGGLIGFIYMIVGASLGLSGFVLLGFLAFLFTCITLAWRIPMTISLKNKINNEEPIDVGFKVCVLIFVNLIAGILLLCHNEE